ncbi:hypothetical protein D1BOALGB6SA_5729 [Olavius sp. associated proteobacterium Delta 1]|nr:hypothetical protein D1BOALGB6SA_5729 [Olavius sp. associated proteobacterium Delta 1]
MIDPPESISKYFHQISLGKNGLSTSDIFIFQGRVLSISLNLGNFLYINP